MIPSAIKLLSVFFFQEQAIQNEKPVEEKEEENKQQMVETIQKGEEEQVNEPQMFEVVQQQDSSVEVCEQVIIP